MRAHRKALGGKVGAAETSRRDPDRNIWESADSAEEARAAIERILASDTWTPEGAEEYGGEETEPAYVALVREEFNGDIVNGLISLSYGGITFPCDEGTLRIERER
jgi:hypothetical protein